MKEVVSMSINELFFLNYFVNTLDSLWLLNNKANIYLMNGHHIRNGKANSKIVCVVYFHFCKNEMCMCVFQLSVCK